MAEQPQCTSKDNKNDGSIYTCKDQSCPVHGERNRTYGWSEVVYPLPRIVPSKELYYIYAERDAGTYGVVNMVRSYYNKETRRFGAKQFATGWTFESTAMAHLDSNAESIRDTYNRQTRKFHFVLGIEGPKELEQSSIKEQSNDRSATSDTKHE